MLERMQNISPMTVASKQHAFRCVGTGFIVEAKLFSAMRPATAWDIVLVNAHQWCDACPRGYYGNGRVDYVHRMPGEPHTIERLIE
jgi:hypothetical protein